MKPKIKQSLRIAIIKKKIRGIELSEEEKVIDKMLCGRMDELPKPKPKPKRKRYTKVEKAEYAINERAKSIENPKWMQKFINFQDKQIPIGKRRVAYVRYLTMTKGMSLRDAKSLSLKHIH